MEVETVGSHNLSRTDATLVADVLQRLGANRVPVTAKALLEESRPEESPTHHLFEWNDARAAEEQRLNRAADLIREVMIVIRRDPDDKPRTVRGFVNVSSGGTRGYMDTVNVLSDAELREQLVEAGLADFKAVERRYQTVTELAAIFAAIDRVSAKRGRTGKPRRGKARPGL